MIRNQVGGRLASALVAFGVVGALTSGCSGGAAPPAASAAPPASSSAAPPAVTTAPAAGPASPPRCTTSELAGSLGQGDAGAGSVFLPLILTNTGSRSCELRGFPGVSYVAGDDGHQVGPAAEMDGDRGGEVVIDVGKAAVAQLRLVNVRNFDADVCRPTSVRGLRVYPPGDTASLFVPMDGTGCAATPPDPQLFVRTLTPVG